MQAVQAPRMTIEGRNDLAVAADNPLRPGEGGGIDVDASNSAPRRPLYAARVKIFPSRVEGFYRRLKWWLLVLFLGIYWLTPWIRWDRGPAVPDQAVLVDLAHRRFYFFFIEIWPQEFYYVAGLLIMAGLGLFLVTSMAGRAWCGYACPQTVWTDLFVTVERWIEGDRNARVKLDRAPWTFTKGRKRLTVWALWLLIALATGGAWVFYFADAPTLAGQLVRFKAPPVAYMTIGVLTATTFIFAGFMREQVCTYMCPWPRIQGAMLDEDSLIVTYHGWRGEPRSRHRKKALRAGRDLGDCVDCNACVAACPMGIDIRDGEQLECITCALCIDACDRIMDRIDRPRGLISYSTLRDYRSLESLAEAAGRDVATERQMGPGLSHVARPRTIAYFALWSLIGIAMLVSLLTRDRLDLTVLHDRAPVFVTLADGSVRNGYTLKLVNMNQREALFTLSLANLPEAEMWLAERPDRRDRSFALTVGPDQVRALRVFVAVPEGKALPSDFHFTLRDEAGEESAVRLARFEAPGGKGPRP